MIIIGELINASRKAIKAAIEAHCAAAAYALYLPIRREDNDGTGSSPTS